jgi:hypothetical protein
MTIPPEPVLHWEPLNCVSAGVRDAPHVLRARVPGGWLVWAHTAHGDGLSFVPDPEHAWDGGSLRRPTPVLAE